MKCSECKTKSCCKEFTIRVKVSSETKGSIFETHFGDGYYIIPIKIEHTCPHLIDGLCDIYEDRPDVCRNYKCKNWEDE